MHFAVGCALLSSVAAATSPEASARRSFDLPAGEAAAVFKQFIAQSRVQLLYVADDATDVRTNSVKGYFTPREAIDRILAGTQLTAIQTANGALAVKKSPLKNRQASPPPAASPATPVSPNKKSSPDKTTMKNPKLISILASVFAFSSADAGAQSAPAAGPDSETVQLSAFKVSTSKDTGYIASDTVTAGRMNTTLLKTPNDVSVLTRDFLNDIAATSIYDSAQWLTNAYVQEPNTRDFGQGNVVFRGLGGSNGYNTRNYFQNPFNMDAYNIARIEGARGPNSIIYADALSGGQVNSVTKRPELRDRNEFGLRLDSEGGIRATLDVDRRITNQVGMRVNGVYQEGRKAVDNYHENRKAIDLAGTYRPWRNAELRVEFESGYSDRSNLQRSYNDVFSSWDGSTSVSAPLTANPAASTGLSRLTTDTLVVLPNGKTYNLIGYAQTNGSGIDMTPDANGINYRGIVPKRSFSGQPDYSRTFGSFRNYSAFFEQSFDNGLALEVAGNAFYINLKGGVETWNNARIDVTRVLPDGSTNPYFGKAYVESTLGGATGNAPSWVDSHRVGLAYKLPVRSFTQTFSLSYQYRDHSYEPENYRYSRTNNGTTPDVRSAVNSPTFRFYWDDPVRTLSLPQSDAVNSYGWVKARDTKQRDNLATWTLATSGSYFGDRLTMVGGFRRDTYTNNSRNISTFDARGYPVADATVITKTSNVMTGSVGAVYFPIKPVGVYYNYSEGFTPNNLTFPNVYGVFGNVPTIAHGKAAGLRFRLMEGKLVGSVGYYQSHEANKPGGNFDANVINRLWVNSGEPAKQIAGGGVQYYDTLTYNAQGYEFDVTANPTRELRFIFNLALPTARQLDSSHQTIAYYKANLTTWQAAANNPNNQNAAQIASDLASFKSFLDGVVDGRELNGAFKYRANLYGTYTFQQGALKNLSFGGGANLYGRRLIGNEVGAPFAFIYNDTYAVVTGSIAYALKVRNYPVKVSLNIDNLLDNKAPQYTGVAGFNGSAYRDSFLYLDPRKFVLSTTVSF